MITASHMLTIVIIHLILVILVIQAIIHTTAFGILDITTHIMDTTPGILILMDTIITIATGQVIIITSTMDLILMI